MKKKVIGYYRTLLGFPDLFGKIKVYGCRWHNRLGFQVKVSSFGSLQWININERDFERA